MPYWMTNPEHGVMPVYSASEIEQAKVHGWELLNEGDSPAKSKPEPVVPVAEPVEVVTKRKYTRKAK